MLFCVFTTEVTIPTLSNDIMKFSTTAWMVANVIGLVSSAAAEVCSPIQTVTNTVTVTETVSGPASYTAAATVVKMAGASSAVAYGSDSTSTTTVSLVFPPQAPRDGAPQTLFRLDQRYPPQCVVKIRQWETHTYRAWH